MMSGNDGEEYNIINGEIPAPKQSYYNIKNKVQITAKEYKKN